MERPHLLWVNHFAVLPSEGGGTRHFELGRELFKRGWRVSIAASDFNLHEREYSRRPTESIRAPIEESVEGVDFRWIWAAPYEKNDWRRGWNWLSFSLGLLRTKGERYRASVVIGSSPHLFAALAASHLAATWKVPFVLEVRDLWPESLIAAGGRKGVAYYGLALIARYLYRRADRIIVLAEGNAAPIAESGIDRDKIWYLPNGVDVSAFETEKSCVNGSSDALVVMYAGAHGPANGLDVVLDAAEMLMEHRGVRFVLVGDGPAKDALVASAANRKLTNVEFRAPVPKRDMPALLRSADAGLMVLRDSPLFAFGVSPNKLFDYLGAGLPVVCNVPGDVASMVRRAAAGEQAADGSARALADAVLRIREMSSEERAAMGRSGRAWVEREHGRSVLAARLDAMLREVVAG